MGLVVVVVVVLYFGCILISQLFNVENSRHFNLAYFSVNFLKQSVSCFCSCLYLYHLLSYAKHNAEMKRTLIQTRTFCLLGASSDTAICPSVCLSHGTPALGMQLPRLWARWLPAA